MKKKKINELNVFHYGYLPWRNFHNWCKNVKNFFINFKFAWDRATKGYCYADLWDLDWFLLHGLRDILTEFKDKHNSYPVDISPEEYCDDLQSIINHLNSAISLEPNNWEQEMWENDKEHFCERSLKKHEKQQEELETALKELSKIFFHLWS